MVKRLTISTNMVKNVAEIFVLDILRLVLYLLFQIFNQSITNRKINAQVNIYIRVISIHQSMDVVYLAENAFLVFFQAIWAMFPAYIANPAAVFFGGKYPIDGGRKWRGKRILGDGKTWTGLIGGGCFGVSSGIVLSMIVIITKTDIFTSYEPYDANHPSYHIIFLVMLLSFGALIGDMSKSLIKRRMGIERGAKSPFMMDQYDFIVGSWLLIIIAYPCWFFRTFQIYHIIVILIVTPLLHRGVNIIGYKIGKKKEPW